MSLSKLPLWGYKQLVHVLQSQSFHSTPLLEGGRKTGSQALEAPFRRFSKKQLKRKANAKARLELKRDVGKEKLKAQHMEKKVHSPEFQEFLEKTNKLVDEIVDASMLPDGARVKSVGERRPKYTGEILSADNVLRRLKHLKEIESENTLTAPQYSSKHLTSGSDELDGLLDQSMLKNLDLSAVENLNASQLDDIDLANFGESDLAKLGVDLSALEGIDFSSLENMDEDALASALRSQSRASPNGVENVVENGIIEAKPVEKIHTFNIVRAVGELARTKRVRDIDDLTGLLKQQGYRLDVDSYTSMISLLSANGLHARAEMFFDTMLAEGHIPDMPAWTALIRAKAKGSGPDEARKVVDRLANSGVPVDVSMYNCVLKALVDQHKFDKALELWIDMHSLVPALDAEAFTVMLKHCAKTHQAERAFFYMDEMKALGIEPTVGVFATLFKAVAEGPHWVHGMHDLIFDAIAMMEGKEIIPNEAVYNSIINCFGRAGDAAAAEFYFWEMREKGFTPSLLTYNTFIGALAKAQTVGAKAYKTKGRYTRPPPPPTTAEEEAYKEIGAHRVTELVASGLFHEYDTERGSRPKGTLFDVQDEDWEARDDLREAVLFEASQLRQARGGRLHPEVARLKAKMEAKKKNQLKYYTPVVEKVKAFTGLPPNATSDAIDWAWVEEVKGGKLLPLENKEVMMLRERDERIKAQALKVERHRNPQIADFEPVVGSGRKWRAAIADAEANDGDGNGDGNDDDDGDDDDHMDEQRVQGDGSDEGEHLGRGRGGGGRATRARVVRRKGKDKRSTEATDTLEAVVTTTTALSIKTAPSPPPRAATLRDFVRSVQGSGLVPDHFLVGHEKNNNSAFVVPTAQSRPGSSVIGAIITGRRRLGDNSDMDSDAWDSGDDNDKDDDDVKGDDVDPRSSGAAPASEGEERNEFFFDPFSDIRDTNKRRREQEKLGSSSSPMSEALVEIIDAKTMNSQGQGTLLTMSEFGAALLGGDKNKPKELHGESADGDKLSALDEELMLRQQEKQRTEELWDLVEFGRPPEPDYSVPLKYRRIWHGARAELVFAEMKNKGVCPDVITLNSMLTVYADGELKEDALRVLESFKSYGLQPNRRTHSILIRMHIRLRDIGGALEAKKTMLEQNMLPDGNTYGMLMQALVNREMLVEGLHLLEEVTEKGVKVPDFHMRVLRGRCKNMGIVHPDMPPDPHEWVKDIKTVRKNRKQSSKSSVQDINSKSFV